MSLKLGWTPYGLQKRDLFQPHLSILSRQGFFLLILVYLGGIGRKWVGEKQPLHWNFEDLVLWAATAKENSWWIPHTWELSAHAKWAHHQKCKRRVCGNQARARGSQGPLPDLPYMWSSTSTCNKKEKEATEDQALWVQQVMTLGLHFVAWAHLPCLTEMLRWMQWSILSHGLAHPSSASLH